MSNTTLAPVRPLRATKAELRREIAELRSVGGRMANMCFNWAQHEGYRMTVDCELMDTMRREWDAIKRAERRAD